MPDLGAAAIVSLISAGLGGTEFLVNQLDKPGGSTPSTVKPPLTQAQNASTTAAVGQQLPNLQSLTGGSLSPEYAASVGGINSGNANNPQASGDIQAAINQFFGLSAPGSTGLTPSAGSNPGGPGIMDLLTKGGGGGGANLGGWVQQQLQGNQFSGLQG